MSIISPLTELEIDGQDIGVTLEIKPDPPIFLKRGGLSHYLNQYCAGDSEVAVTIFTNMVREFCSHQVSRKFLWNACEVNFPLKGPLENFPLNFQKPPPKPSLPLSKDFELEIELPKPFEINSEDEEHEAVMDDELTAYQVTSIYLTPLNSESDSLLRLKKIIRESLNELSQKKSIKFRAKVSVISSTSENHFEALQKLHGYQTPVREPTIEIVYEAPLDVVDL